MRRASRYDGVRMNFDAMTDTISNFAGTLIRLVILVLAITQPKSLDSEGQLSEVSKASADIPARSNTADLRLLKAILQDTETKIDAVTRELAELQARIRKLGPADGTTTQGDAAPPSDPAEVVPFRPPLERMTGKKAVILICQDERISVFDASALNQRMNAILQAERRKARFDLTDSDFHIEANSDGESWSASRRPGHPGETWAEAQRPNSPLRQALAAAKPLESYVMFVVWHDSHTIFRNARAAAWKGGFEVGWEPMAPNEKLTLRAGGLDLGFVQ